VGYKSVCVNCRIAFNHDTDFNNTRSKVCPECSKEMIEVSHNFKPPKKSNLKGWKVVQYLIDNGFIYQHIYKTIVKTKNGITKYQSPVKYPMKMDEAKEFVMKYREQSIKK
jgi:hypothetical protein